jgi:hypothetical protein
LADFEKEVNEVVKDYFEKVLEGVTDVEADVLKNSEAKVLCGKASLKYVFSIYFKVCSVNVLF